MRSVELVPLVEAPGQGKWEDAKATGEQQMQRVANKAPTPDQQMQRVVTPPPPKGQGS